MSAEFLVDEGIDGSLLDRVASALSARIVHTRAEHTAWLDTQDWRLFHAGLLLEQGRSSREAWLDLSDLNGARLARVPVAPGTVTLATLPEGAIKQRVSRVVGIRELITRAAAEGPASRLAVLDEQAKTVARVAVQGPLAVNGGNRVGVRVRVEPVRGYGKHAQRVARRLAALPGLAVAERSTFEEVAGAHGVVPGHYRAKPDLRLTPGMPAAEAFSAALGQLLEIVRSNLDGTVRQLDTEFLHDLRVAVRRSRSVLKAARTVIDEQVRRTYVQEMRWLAGETSASRDLDVYLLGFDDMVLGADAESLEPFRRLLVQRHEQAHAELNQVLRSQRCTALLDGWQRELAQPEHTGSTAGRPVGDTSRALLRRAWTRVQKRGNAIGPHSPAESLHDLRKRCKELRYLLELFASLHDSKVHRRLVGELKRLQDNLGEFQDAESQRDLVLSCAEDLRAGGAPVETLLTMGRMEQRMQQRQAAVRDDFAACWTRFGDRQNRRRFEAVLSSG